MKFALALLATLLSSTAMAAGSGPDEAGELLAAAAKRSGRPAYSEATAVSFKPSDHVYLKSALAVDFTFRAATVTLPLFGGLGPDGHVVYYILTEASDFEVAKRMGLNYAPKMANVVGHPGAQQVTLEDGVIRFKGKVDFAPAYAVAPGSPEPFPPSVAKPGAVADAAWSSMVVLPSGVVVNAQLVHNASGTHDRVKAIDLEKRTVTMSLLDGVHNGKPFFYHMVTDVSAEVPSVLEKGVYAPGMAMIPSFGKSTPAEPSALLGFSPVVNGVTDKDSPEFQGFAGSLANGGIDPVNVFPLPPANDDPSAANNYSPLWDAHVSMWTAEAFKAGKVRRITSLDDLKQLVAAGLVTSASINPPGPGNPFVAGLRPTQAIINCPVIAQPEL